MTGEAENHFSFSSSLQKVKVRARTDTQTHTFSCIDDAVEELQCVQRRVTVIADLLPSVCSCEYGPSCQAKAHTNTHILMVTADVACETLPCLSFSRALIKCGKHDSVRYNPSLIHTFVRNVLCNTQCSYRTHTQRMACTGDSCTPSH